MLAKEHEKEQSSTMDAFSDMAVAYATIESADACLDKGDWQVDECVEAITEQLRFVSNARIFESNGV